MKKKAFPISMIVLWGTVFIRAMYSKSAVIISLDDYLQMSANVPGKY